MLKPLLLPAKRHYFTYIKLVGCGSSSENYVVAGMILVAHILGDSKGLPGFDWDTVYPYRVRGSGTKEGNSVASAALNHLRLSDIQGLCGSSHVFAFVVYSPNVT